MGINLTTALKIEKDFDSIDWAVSKESIISRVVERGTEDEIAEIARFYGMPLDSLSEWYK